MNVFSNWIIDLRGGRDVRTKLTRITSFFQLDIEMIGAYALEKFPQNLVKDLALELLDFDPEARGQFYREKSLHA